MNKKYNFPAVNRLTQFYSDVVTEFAGNFRKTFRKLFCPGLELVTTKFIMRLRLQKIQFYGCKRSLYFNKASKILLRKFPPEKNPPENIFDNFVKFRKFFRQGNISENFGENVIRFYE